MNQFMTPRAARQRLNQIEFWLKRNPHYFRPTHLLMLHTVLEDLMTPEHVRELEGYLRKWMLSDEKAAAQKATMDETIRKAVGGPHRLASAKGRIPTAAVPA